MFSNLFRSEKTAFATLPIQLYNTSGGQKEIFQAQNDGVVLMYSCGPTVYDYAHIGNLRSYVFSDILKRTLQFHGYAVSHTINFTDFGHLTDDGDAGEDKMMKGLKREGLPVTLEAMRDLSDRYIRAFTEDFAALRIIPPTTWARASEYIPEQIKLIATLQEAGYTYETSDGVYFDISKFPAYGKLGNINLSELKSGARVEINTEKRQAADFAVWKKGTLGWDSRWGKGFPGWHIECSAMAMATLSETIDIHTGGIDHIPVHHNAEIAQCECATGKTFARYWLHNAFLSINNTKVSKSLGNTFTLRQLFEQGFTGEDYRYWLLTAHYRSPVNFSWEALAAAKQALFRLRRLVYEEYQQVDGVPETNYVAQLRSHLANDLDTPAVIALLWQITKDTNLDNPTKCATIKVFDSILDVGLSATKAEGQEALGTVTADEIPSAIQTLLDKREAARIANNWFEADTLREAIKIKGYNLEDTPHGPKLSKILD